jgi:lipid-A-disaccharide synthase
MNVFISAGETSGDAYGAALASELTKLGEDKLLITGIGGAKLSGLGFDLVANSNSWGAISITESLKVVPRVFRGFAKAKKRLRGLSPGLFVPIDFGYMNIRLARYARKLGWKVLYFVPPGSWRKDRQGKDLGALTDAISTPFQWSSELLKATGANAHWFGHPIKQLLAQTGPSIREAGVIAILPGSREHEIKENLPLIAALAKEWPQRSFVFALAPWVNPESFKQRWSNLAGKRENDRFRTGETHSVLKTSEVAIVCSGTATLEAALCRCPMVVVYRVGKLLEFEAKLVGFKAPKFIALPNILLDRMIVPEFLQKAATVENVKAALQDLLGNSQKRNDQLTAFDELDRELGDNSGITQTALLGLGLVGISLKSEFQ